MRYLNFEIAEEGFGIELKNVKEVIAFPRFTPTPGAPKYFLGFMTLRDQVIPLIDLRIRMGIEPTLTLDTSVIVCYSDGKVFGLVVDVIYTVVTPEEKDVLQVPAMADEVNGEFLAGVVRGFKGLVLLLNVDKLLVASQAQVEQLREVTSKIRESA
jgi:purine-binding chemotaxis protein CheW